MTDLLKELEALADGWAHEGVVAENHYIEGRNDQRGICMREVQALIASEKARGPDPLLVQAREALAEMRRVISSIDFERTDEAPNNDDMNRWDSTIAALDAKLGGKE